MTDAFIETTLSDVFKTLSLIKTETVNGKTITNVYWQNETFDRSKWLDKGWYEIDFIPGEPVQSELGTAGRNRWVGILQVTICVPINAGKAMANARYNAIALLYPRGSVFSGIEITNAAYRGQEDTEADHYRLPVRVEYRADLAN